MEAIILSERKILKQDNPEIHLQEPYEDEFIKVHFIGDITFTKYKAIGYHVNPGLPNLRRISVSPWSNKAVLAEMLKSDYIYSMKPNPAHLALPTIDESLIRENLRESLKITRDCRVEIIMKDNNTIGKNPQNVINWCKIAREEAERI